MADRLDATLQVILDHLKHVRRGAAGSYTAQCNCHDDHNNSLSITRKGDRILIKCHVGCRVEDIVHKMGLEMADLFLKEEKAARKVVATYDYGTFQTVRFEPKGFAQRRRKNNQWVWNLDGVRTVLYRLPELLVADDRTPVYIVEGEKDVETLRALGLVATTSPMGAGKWKEEYTQSLYGKKQVVVISDADAVGRAHAQTVAASCHAAGIAVRLVELPFAKDVSEWLEHQHSKSDLESVVYSTPLWKPPAPGALPEEDGCLEFGAFMAQEFADSGVPLIEGLINREGRVFVIAQPKHLKSWLALSIAFEASLGLKVFGRFRAQAPVRVLYCQFEDPKGALQDRCQKLIKSHNDLRPPPGNFILQATGGVSCDLMQEESYRQVEGWCARHKPELLVLDVMRKIFHGNLNDTKDVSPFLDRLDALKNKFHCAILLVHYSPKNAGTVTAAGSVYFEGWYDTEIKISKKRKSGTRILTDLEFETKSKPIDKLTMCYDETAQPILTVTEDIVGDYLEIAKKHLAAKWTINDVAKILQLGYDTARRLIEQWEKEDRCEFEARAKGQGRGGMKTWKWRASDEEPEERY